MRQLHVLGVSEDGATLLLGTTKNSTKPTYRITLDDRLRAAARGQLAVTGDRAESALSPKEIQARMRAGSSPEEVAKAAGVPVARVLPYFAPVEAERDRIVAEARAAVLHRHRAPDGVRPLGVVVDARLAETAGLKGESVAWTARRRADGAWVVGVTYAARGGRRKAEWLWQPASRDLSALDAAATRLGTDTPAGTTRRRAAKKTARPAARKPAASKPAKKAAAKRAPARKKAAPTKAAASNAGARPTRAVKPAATKAAAKKAAVKKAALTKAAVKKAAVKRVAKPAAAKPVASARTATPKPAVRKAGSVARRRAARTETAPVVTVAPVVEVVPDVKPDQTPEVVAPQVVAPQVAPEPAAPAAAARRPGQRVPLPSWSDVLIGVSGSRDDAARSTPPPPPRAGRRRAG